MSPSTCLQRNRSTLGVHTYRRRSRASAARIATIHIGQTRRASGRRASTSGRIANDTTTADVDHKETGRPSAADGGDPDGLGFMLSPAEAAAASAAAATAETPDRSSARGRVTIGKGGRMLSASNSLWSRGLVLLGMSVLTRAGCNIPTPGVDLSVAVMMRSRAAASMAADGAAVTSAAAASLNAMTNAATASSGATAAASATAAPTSILTSLGMAHEASMGAIRGLTSKLQGDVAVAAATLSQGSGVLNMTEEIPFNILCVGVQPMIAANITLGILCLINPELRSMRTDPTGKGRTTLTQMQFWLTVGLCAFFGAFQAYVSLGASIAATGGLCAFAVNAITYTAGALALYQISNCITEHGLGEGFLVIISLSIIAGFSSNLNVFVSACISGALPWYFAAGLGGVSIFAIAVALVLSEAAVHVPITVFSERGGATETRTRRDDDDEKLSPGADQPRETEFVRIQANPGSTGPLLSATMALELATFLGLLSAGSTLKYVCTMLLVVFFNVIDFSGANYRLDSVFTHMGSQIRGLRPGLQTITFLQFLSTTLRISGGILLGLLAVGGQVVDRWLVNELGTEPLGLSSLIILVGMGNQVKRQAKSLLQVPKLRTYIDRL